VRECPGGKPGRGVKAEGGIIWSSEVGRCTLFTGCASAPPADLDFLEGFELERICWDPKDCELWVTRTKPEETLVEVRSDTDVQIVHLSCL
jgi:hypothetical protein